MSRDKVIPLYLICQEDTITNGDLPCKCNCLLQLFLYLQLLKNNLLKIILMPETYFGVANSVPF